MRPGIGKATWRGNGDVRAESGRHTGIAISGPPNLGNVS